MTAAQLAEAMSLTVLSLPRPDAPVTGGYAGDLLSWVMGRAAPGDAWLTIMSNVNVAAVALMAEVSCVILAEGVRPDEALLQRCAEHEINLLGSAGGVFPLAAELAARLRG
ncbi:hypothetical protein SDC9_165532 [bioreactor metagenome]|uniref:DRTGG domain-containing protein n=1 Tax=bioreactor metagenome TaxID=1076179 RepID=A0A645G210_9ZZZZ